MWATIGTLGHPAERGGYPIANCDKYGAVFKSHIC
jgi:hypothetical protein